MCLKGGSTKTLEPVGCPKGPRDVVDVGRVVTQERVGTGEDGSGCVGCPELDPGATGGSGWTESSPCREELAEPSVKVRE